MALPNGNYIIINAATNMALNVPGGTLITGVPIIQSYTNPGLQSQQWVYVDLGDGYGTFQNVASGWMLDIPGGIVADNVAAMQWNTDDWRSENWQLSQFGDDTYTIQNYTSQKFLQIPCGIQQENIAVNQQDYIGALYQLWSFVPI